MDIGGKSMLQHLTDRLSVSQYLDDIIICTSTHPDDAILIDKAKEWKVKSFAGSERDVLNRFTMAAQKFDSDHIVRVTGDNPLTCPVAIDRMIERHVETDADYTRTNDLPVGVAAEVMNVRMLEPLARLIPDPTYSGYMVLYAFDPEHFHCEVLTASPEVNRPNYSLTVDTPDDLAFMRHIFKNVKHGEAGPAIVDVVKFLDLNQEYNGISDDLEFKMPGGSTMSFKDFKAMMQERTINSCRRENT